jgi:glycosyltransferase involved in cell wall biosynthesis
MVLWKLAQLLYKKFPGKVFVTDKNQGPLSIPTYDKCKEPLQNCIALYPEVVVGNPLNAGTVIRYILNLPGVIGGSLFYPDSDQMFIYSKFFNQKMNYPQDRILTTPYLDYETFEDRHEKRSGKLFYKGKGTISTKLNAEDIGSAKSYDGVEGQKTLTNKLNKAEVLYSFDSITAMSDIARLCGCPVVIVPNNQYSKEDCQAIDTWDLDGICYGIENERIAKESISSDKIKGWFVQEEENFSTQLDNFIKITQSNLPMNATQSILNEGIEVSICCATYNQVNILPKAIESFLMQKTSFPFEIVIHDDASTDGTQELIKAYAAKHPNIRPIFQTKNQFKSTKKWPFGEHIYPQAKGRYIAECDGDDHWTDPLKLQKQYDFMESHPECSLCYHDYLIFEKGTYRNTSKPVPHYTRLELVSYPCKGYEIQTSTKFWRNIYTPERKQDFIDFTADVPTTIFNGMHGEAKYVSGIKPSIFWLKSPTSSWCSLPKDKMHKQTVELWQYLYNVIAKKGNPQWTALRQRFLPKVSNTDTIIISRAIYNKLDDSVGIGILSNHRLELIQRYFINSLKNQTDKEFTIYLVVGSEHNEATQKIKSLDWGSLNIKYIYTSDDLSDWKKSVCESKVWGRETDKGSPEDIIRNLDLPKTTIMARMDIDDWVSPGWISHMKHMAKTHNEDNFLINYQVFGQDPDGRLYKYNASHSRTRTSPFIALVQKSEQKIGPYETVHFQMGKLFNTVYTIPPSYVFMVIHEENRANKIYKDDKFYYEKEQLDNEGRSTKITKTDSLIKTSWRKKIAILDRSMIEQTGSLNG